MGRHHNDTVAGHSAQQSKRQFPDSERTETGHEQHLFDRDSVLLFARLRGQFRGLSLGRTLLPRPLPRELGLDARQRAPRPKTR
jgi:hypothetical protein